MTGIWPHGHPFSHFALAMPLLVAPAVGWYIAPTVADDDTLALAPAARRADEPQAAALRVRSRELRTAADAADTLRADAIVTIAEALCAVNRALKEDRRLDEEERRHAELGTLRAAHADATAASDALRAAHGAHDTACSDHTATSADAAEALAAYSGLRAAHDALEASQSAAVALAAVRAERDTLRSQLRLAQ